MQQFAATWIGDFGHVVPDSRTMLPLLDSIDWQGVADPAVDYPLRDPWWNAPLMHAMAAGSTALVRRIVESRRDWRLATVPPAEAQVLLGKPSDALRTLARAPSLLEHSTGLLVAAKANAALLRRKRAIDT